MPWAIMILLYGYRNQLRLAAALQLLKSKLHPPVPPAQSPSSATLPLFLSELAAWVPKCTWIPALAFFDIAKPGLVFAGRAVGLGSLPSKPSSCQVKASGCCCSDFLQKPVVSIPWNPARSLLVCDRNRSQEPLHFLFGSCFPQGGVAFSPWTYWPSCFVEEKSNHFRSLHGSWNLVAKALLSQRPLDFLRLEQEGICSEPTPSLHSVVDKNVRLEDLAHILEPWGCAHSWGCRQKNPLV